MLRIRLKSSVDAMKFWALQYADFVTVEYPDSLKEKILVSLSDAAERYRKP